MNARTSIRSCLLTASVIATSALAAVAADLPEAAPGDAGLAAELGERVDVVLGRYENVHGVVILHDGKIVLERYLTGDDEKMGWPVKGVTFGPDVLHDVRSITKSVIGLLYGIALAEGEVPPLDAPLVDSFPEYSDLATPQVREITIEDALTMRLGFEWREFGPQPTTEIEMLHQADRYRFTLSQPIAAKPGTVWNYNGGGTTLLSQVIARGTGMSIADYGEEKLFGPLGIDDYEWFVDYFGVPYGHAGLRFRPRDLAKLGQLILNDGVWDGRQIVPADWLAASFERGIGTGGRCDYGYLWWLCSAFKGGEPVIEGMGLGGNQLMVVPDFDLVLAVTRGQYQDDHADTAARAILEVAVIPSLTSP